MAPSKASRHTRIYPACTLLPWPTMLLLYVVSEARARPRQGQVGAPRGGGEGGVAYVSCRPRPCAYGRAANYSRGY